MNLFSQEKLLKMVSSAKKHWWIFVPVLILISLGFLFFSIIDAIQILFLHIRNFFLTIAMLIRNGMRGIALLFSNMAKGIGNAFKRVGTKMSQGWHRYSENAATARTQLLNSAVDFCANKAQKSQNKKQHLNQIAQRLRSDTKPEIASLENISDEPKTI